MPNPQKIDLCSACVDKNRHGLSLGFCVLLVHFLFVKSYTMPHVIKAFIRKGDMKWHLFENPSWQSNNETQQSKSC